MKFTNVVLIVSFVLAAVISVISIFYTRPPQVGDAAAVGSAAGKATSLLAPYGIEFTRFAPLPSTFVCGQDIKDASATSSIRTICGTSSSEMKGAATLALVAQKDIATTTELIRYVADEVRSGLPSAIDRTNSTYACESTPVASPQGIEERCTIALGDATHRFVSVFTFQTPSAPGTVFALYAYDPKVTDAAMFALTGSTFESIIHSLLIAQPKLSWLRFFGRVAHAQTSNGCPAGQINWSGSLQYPMCGGDYRTVGTDVCYWAPGPSGTAWGWYGACLGSSGGAYAVDGSCGVTTYSCASGGIWNTSTQNGFDFWDCVGYNGGATAYCVMYPYVDLTVSANQVTTDPATYQFGSTLVSNAPGIQLQGFITNIGDTEWIGYDGNHGSFNNIMQVATGADGSGAITTLAPQMLSTVGRYTNTVLTWPYTFTSSGVYSIRACADMAYAGDPGAIVESNENNNCGAWTNVTIQPNPYLPDLIVGTVSSIPAMATLPTSFTATVTNNTWNSVGAGFNNFMQIASAANGGGTIIGISATRIESAQIDPAWKNYSIDGSHASAGISASYVFPAGGTYSVRACTDMGYAGDPGAIVEANENNNCGAWSNISIPPLPSPTASISAVPMTVANGAGTQLTWSSTNAQYCERSGVAAATLGQYTSGQIPTSGTVTTWPLQVSPTPFNLRCLGIDGTYAYATVSVTISPATATLSASPSSISPGGQSTLTWSSTNATSCTAAGGFSTGNATSGSATVSPVTTSTYSVTCTGPGSASSPATATVTVIVPTLSITSSPNRVPSGGTVTVTWNATNVNSCTITRNGAVWKNLVADASKVVAGSSPDTITGQTTYVLACKDINGAAIAAAATTIANVSSSLREY